MESSYLWSKISSGHAYNITNVYFSCCITTIIFTTQTNIHISKIKVQIYVKMFLIFLIMQKKSREESHGEGSGVEIIINEPYNDGPGGKGQYTKKIYHVGSHLPGWIKSKTLFR